MLSVNDTLLSMGIPLMFVSIEKNRKGHVKNLAKTIFNSLALKKVKVLIFLEANMDISSVADAVWRFSNNVDPKRDHLVITSDNDDEVNHIVFDGTRKTKEFDGFERDWPNILAADEATAKHVDEIWSRLGLGAFIPSPSERYRKQLYKGGAVAEN